jgi:hypothetical protein
MESFVAGLPKIVPFVLFVIVDLSLPIGYSIVKSRKGPPQFSPLAAGQVPMTPGRYFIYSQDYSLLHISSFILPLVLLAGYFNGRLFLLIFVALEVGILVTVVLFWFLESNPSRWYARQVTLNRVLAQTHPYAALLFFVAFPVLLLIVVLIVTGVIYFSYSGDQLTIRLFQLQSIALLLGAAWWTAYHARLLIAPSADENTRSHIFAIMFGRIFLVGIWLAIAFWAFQDAPRVTTDPIQQDFPLQISPLLFALLVSLFFCCVVVPYVIGARRGKQFRTDLHQKQKEHVDRIASVLRMPARLMDISGVMDDLQDLREDLLRHLVEETRKCIGVQPKSELDTMPDSELDTLLREVMKNPEALTSSDLPENILERVQPIVTEDENTGDLDPRYGYLRQVRTLTEQVWQAKDDLEHLEAEIRGSRNQFELRQWREAWRQPWLQTFDDQSERLDKTIQAEESAKPRLLATASTLMSMVGAVFIDNVAVWVWEIFQSSLGH